MLKSISWFYGGGISKPFLKIHSLPLEQVLEWKRLTTYGHTDWTEGTKRKYSIEEKRLILQRYFCQSLGCKHFAALNNVSCGLLRHWVRKVKKFGSIDSAYPAIRNSLLNSRSNFEIIAWALYEVKQNHRSTREVAEQLGYNIRSVQRLCRQYLLNSDFCRTVNSAYQHGTTMATINQKNQNGKSKH